MGAHAAERLAAADGCPAIPLSSWFTVAAAAELGVRPQKGERMAFRTTNRYGGMNHHGDGADIPAVVAELLEELETERFEEPDNEHTEVSVRFEQWTLSVHVSGLISLQDLSWIKPGGKLGRRIPPVCRWARTHQGVADLLAMLARGEIEQLRAKVGWVRRDELPTRKGGDFFRRRK
jgi:hypothetical protein